MATKGTALRSLSRPHLRASTTALTGDRNIMLASATPAAGATVSSTLGRHRVARELREEGSGRATAARCGEPSATTGRTSRGPATREREHEDVLIPKEFMTSATFRAVSSRRGTWYTALAVLQLMELRLRARLHRLRLAPRRRACAPVEHHHDDHGHVDHACPYDARAGGCRARLAGARCSRDARGGGSTRPTRTRAGRRCGST